jgi:hypothetical protein
MAQDPDTQKLIKQLLGGVPVEVVALDAGQQLNDKALPSVPPCERAVFVGICPLSLHRVQQLWIRPDGSYVPYLGPAKLPKDAKRVSYLEVQMSWAFRAHLPSLKQKIDYFSVLFLAANDYLLRHRLGCQIQHSLGPRREPGETIVATAEAARAAQDEKIEEYQKQYKLQPLPK